MIIYPKNYNKELKNFFVSPPLSGEILRSTQNDKSVMFKQYTLPNGLRVVLAPLHETKAVTVLVLVKIGSRYETRMINGVSHFVEHLMFKGTEKRPTSLAITRELDGVGAEYNAFTAKDHTGYYIKANHEKTELVLDMLSDILFHSTFQAGDIDRERGVIVEEINMYEDNPLMLMEDLFEQTVYGDCPLGWSIAGSKSVIKKVLRKGLHDYYKKHYVPHQMLVAVAGNIGSTIEARVKHYFGTQATHRQQHNFKKVTAKQNSPQIRVKYKDTEQVQVALGFPGYSYADKKLYALYLMSVILGGNMSSRLFMSIREKKGLCYFIRSGVNVYQDTGNLMIQAGLDKTRIKEAIRAILAELKKLRDKGVRSAELRKAKDFLRGKLILELEASDHVASWLSRQELLQDRILTPAQQIERLERVPLSEIKAIASNLIKTSKINLTVIGPFKQKEQFSDLLRI